MAERKRYIEVEVPALATSFRVLGTLENLPKKTIRLDMSRKMRGKGLIVTLQIFNHEEKLVAVPKKLELSRSYIKKMMRKRVDYVEDSFTSKCSDISCIIKPFLITRKRVSRAVRKNLRNTAKEIITEYLKEKEFGEASADILNSTLQKTMLPRLKKVYPLSFCEIRVFQTKEIDKIDLEKVSAAPVEEEKEEVQDTKPEEAETQEETKETGAEDLEDAKPEEKEEPKKDDD